MAIKLGPVLGFQGVDDSGPAPRWQLGVLLVGDGDSAPAVQVDAPAQLAAPVCLKTYGKFKVWRFDLSLALGAQAQRVGYRVEGKDYAFTAPPAGSPPRMAYTSCNGFSALKLMKQVKLPYANWQKLGELNDAAPYHLLVMGGDQVYADALWETIPALRTWNELAPEKAARAPFGATLNGAVEKFYFELYCARWSEANTARVLASVPTLMMWDDHDIFDGWGSYPAEQLNSPVFQGIFAQAKAHFALFQRQGVVNAACLAPELAYSVAHKVGGIGLLVLDLRSERTIEQVMSPAHWEKVYAWLDKAAAGLSHLIVVSSIPVMHPSFGALEQGLGLFPGQQELEDDLRDHWTSRGHAGERLRLIHRLLGAAAQTRVTIVSGDVHIAALGVIESTRQGGSPLAINQLTSSGIVHPPPAGALLFALNHLFDTDEEIDRGIDGRMLKFPGTAYRFIGKRNWLSLEPDSPSAGQKPRIWANWYVEGESQPYTKVIHPV